MALVTTDFNINITPGSMPPVVHVSEYDIGRSYTVGLIGENNDTFTIPTGTTATIEGTLNGVVGFSVPATINNNKVAFTLTESMTAYAGKAWCKIKLTLNSQPIQTCAFVLAVDRAGVESETVIGAPGFEEQIQTAVDAYLDEHPVSGEGWTDEIKQALLACFRGVAWLNDNDFSDKYTALENALYPDTPTPPPSYLTGYTIAGNPTIDSNYRMTTSDGNFIKTPFNFDNGGKSWELRGKVNASDENQPTGGLQWYDIANFVNSNNQSIRGLLVEFNRSTQDGSGFTNKFNLFASSVESSWNIISPTTESFAVTSLINGDFYFKAGWTGSAYYIAASADGVTWSNELRHEWTGKTTSIMTGYPIAFGNKRNAAWGYCIYINSLELDIDGTLYWKAVE